MKTKHVNKYVVSLIAIIALILSHAATVNAAEPPVPGAILATPVTTTTTTPGPTTTTITASKTTELIRAFEKRTKSKVVFYWVEKGIKTPKGQKDYDPVKEGVIKVGDKFSNTWVDVNGKSVRFWDKWRKGDKLVDVRRGEDSIGKYIEGTIKRCGNKKIRIYLNLKKVKKKKVKKVSEWKSKDRFVEKNAESISTNSSSTTVTTTVYICPTGFTLTGIWCIPIGGKDGDPGAGNGNSGVPGDDKPGSGDSGTAPSAPCWLPDGNNDPTIPGRWDNVNKVCVRI